MDGHAIYMHRYAKNNDFPIDFAIFTEVLRTDGPTDQRTNGPTDQRTDIPSYRLVIAASKNDFIYLVQRKYGHRSIEKNSVVVSGNCILTLSKIFYSQRHSLNDRKNTIFERGNPRINSVAAETAHF